MKLYSIYITAKLTAVDPLDAANDLQELTVKELVELYGTALEILEISNEPESTEETDTPVTEVE